MASKTTWVKVALKIRRDQIGLMVGKRGAVLFGDIQTPVREEYMKYVNEKAKKEDKINYPSTNFKMEFPGEDPKDTKVYVRWSYPHIIKKSDAEVRKVFNQLVLKNLSKIQSRILEISASHQFKKTFRVRASTEHRRVGMFIGNGGENVNKLKTKIKDTLGLTGRVWVDILEEGDDEIEYMYHFDDDTDDSAWFSVKFNYLEDNPVNEAEVESMIEEFLSDFEDEEDEELLGDEDEEILGEW